VTGLRQKYAPPAAVGVGPRILLGAPSLQEALPLNQGDGRGPQGAAHGRAADQRVLDALPAKRREEFTAALMAITRTLQQTAPSWTRSALPPHAKDGYAFP
jgi:hypothetical protein